MTLTSAILVLAIFTIVILFLQLQRANKRTENLQQTLRAANLQAVVGTTRQNAKDPNEITGWYLMGPNDTYWTGNRFSKNAQERKEYPGYNRDEYRRLAKSLGFTRVYPRDEY